MNNSQQLEVFVIAWREQVAIVVAFLFYLAFFKAIFRLV